MADEVCMNFQKSVCNGYIGVRFNNINVTYANLMKWKQHADIKFENVCELYRQ